LDYAVERDAADLLQIKTWKAAARRRALEEGDRGGYGQETGPSAKEKEKKNKNTITMMKKQKISN
jgi:hypothetical protein